MLQKKLPTVLSVASLVLLLGLYFLSVPLLKGEAPSSDSAASEESEKIAEMLRKGLRINAQNNPDLPDADAYGAALTQIALERFVKCPDAASKISSAFAAHVENSPAMVRYVQWNIFFEYLERSQAHCPDSESLRRSWLVRSQIIKGQDKILLEIIRQTEEMFDTFTANLKTSDASSVKTNPFHPSFAASDELRNHLDFLLNDNDSNASSDTDAAIERIRMKAVGIADALKKEIETTVSELERKLEVEKEKDISLHGTDAFVPEKNGDGSWKTGTYQKLLDEILRLHSSLEDDMIVYWEGFRDDDETASDSVQVRLKTLFENARRLQTIRYNLWATRRLSGTVTFDTLALIDTGLLISSVGALYSTKESELMQSDEPTQRAGHVRRLILGNKAGLNAF